MKEKKPYRFIISGGGTGGHIFPAISIANEIRERYPDAEILFVGAQGRMEMTRVPEAGYKIIGLWISGIQRKFSLSNFLLPLKVVSSYVKANNIVRRFKPNVAIGTGGYASGPLMMAAVRNKIPSLIQEQNSYAGLTNKQLGEKVQRVCVAYKGMEKYFPDSLIRLTGNPVRKDILQVHDKRSKALSHFGFSDNGRTLLILGGSLGARTINESIKQDIDKLIDAQVQVIWQTGKSHYQAIKADMQSKDLKRVRIYDFLKQMDLAYAAADVVVSRAGALAISEVCVAEKPCILVPSPNVAEDHQTKNALALVEEHAAVVVRDAEATELLVSEALKLVFDESRCDKLSASIAKIARPKATEDIVNEIEQLINA